MEIVKTSELVRAALDWAVAKCEGLPDTEYSRTHMDAWPFCTDWAQGGPIIEREAITVSQGSPVRGLEWTACDQSLSHIQHGPSYLIAAMRCYVASKLGDTINVPEELL